MELYGDDGASRDPGIAIDSDPIAQVLVVAVEEVPNLPEPSLFGFHLAAVPIACRELEADRRHVGRRRLIDPLRT